MEGLGAAASMIAVIQITASIASLLKDYCESARDARAEIQRLYHCVSYLQMILSGITDLSKQYEGSKMFSALLVDSGGPLPLLREELKGLVAKLSSDFGGNERVKRRKTALKWPIQKGDLQKMVAGIEKHQNALVLGLSVENL